LHAYNFEYDGQLLSDFGFVVCSFGTSSGTENGNSGSEISFETVPVQMGKHFYRTGTSYKSCLSATFQICKNPDLYSEEEMILSEDDFRRLSRWLNRREYLWFHGFDWCTPEVMLPWFRASFTLRRIETDSDTIGVELKMTTDSPFGYGDLVTKTLTFESANDTAAFRDQNDEIGDTYPELTVTCGASGTLTLEDDVTGCLCEVENCVNGETLHFTGETMIIETDSVTHEATLANDFNYEFFRFGNTYDNRENIITASMPCTVVIKYRPIIKNTL